MCLEPTKNNRFSFPCGHGICTDCNDKMLARQFLACPTCRTPREGVSQRQVEMANQSRADPNPFENDANGFNTAHASTIFFPDESGGANPFNVLTERIGAPLYSPHFNNQPQDEDEALARVLQAEEDVGQRLPLQRTTSVRYAVHGPMRELVDRLLSPVPMSEFLAQREVVRRHYRR